MRFTSTISTIPRSAWVTSLEKVTESSGTQSERKFPPKELRRHSNKTSTSQSTSVLYYTETGSIVGQMRYNKSWST